MVFNSSRNLVPIQNLLEVRDFGDRLRQCGVANLGDAEALMNDPEVLASILHEDEIELLKASIRRYDREQVFGKRFKWELLAYSEETQRQFAEQAPDVFAAEFLETRLVYLSLSTRTLRALEQAGHETIGEVLKAQPELLSTRNLGDRSVGELFRLIGQFARVYRFILANLWSSTTRVEGLIPQLLGPLRERERDVLVKRYGLGVEPMTLREAGDALGISRERARQIQNRAMEKLREGTSIALVDNWVEAHLSDYLRRALISIGGLATTEQIDDASRNSGFSLSLIAQVLEKDVPWLLGRGQLTPVGEELWAVNPPFAELCRTVTGLYLNMTSGVESGAPTQQQIDAIRAAFPSGAGAKRPFPPNEKFIRLVLQHHQSITPKP